MDTNEYFNIWTKVLSKGWEAYDKWHLGMKYLVVEWQNLYLNFLRDSVSFSTELSKINYKIDA